MKKIFFILVVLWSLNSLALVDIEAKQYTQEWSDLKEFIPTRKYTENSKGVFGTNWCSILDMKGECSFKSQDQKELKRQKIYFLVKNKKIVSFTKKQSLYDVIYKDGKVSAILMGSKTVASFTYSNDLLISVTNQWGSVLDYEYLKDKKLTKTFYPDNTNSKIFYDSKGNVSSFIDRDGCLETYNYSQSDEYQKAEVIKECQGKTVAQNSYEFWKKNKKTIKIRSLKNKDLYEVSYDKKGLPNQVISNSMVFHFEHNKDGTVKSKSNLEGRIDYFYKDAKLDKIRITDTFTKKFKETQFIYNDDRVVSVIDSNGSRLVIDYDSQDRIMGIRSKDGKQVNIAYNEDLGKPSFISVKGLGAIKVLYKDNGEIRNIENLQNKEIGFEVGKIFSELTSKISVASNNPYQ